ncbi:MAG: carboxymuconolactone decarboxylase family protein [Bryobacterales bacterium]|nr:carboxymuconolactone decarboxylase family protein [Bryobacterales bacterium]
MTPLIEYDQASPEVRAVYDDIMATRQTDYINNMWKALANHPPSLQRTWARVKEIMGAPGTIDPLVREMIYIAVSVTNNCTYCIATHSAAARAKGMSEETFGELMAIIGLANETNRLANGYRIEVDERYR